MLPSSLCIITDRSRSALPLPLAIQQVVGAGARWIRVREPNLDLFGYVSLCRLLLDECDNARVTWTVRPTAYLLLQSLYPDARFGVHLTARDPCWSAPDVEVLVGRSVHVGDALLATDVARPTEEQRPHYLLLAPVFATTSKPGVTPVGLDALQQITAASAKPIVALGGITRERAAACLAAGAHAVAMCSAVLGSEGPGDIVRALLSERAHDVAAHHTGNSISR